MMKDALEIVVIGLAFAAVAVAGATMTAIAAYCLVRYLP